MSASERILLLIPLAGYILLSLGIAWRARKALDTKPVKSAQGGFIEEYFIGNRSMGGFVLAMSIVASYISASSFVGGPGIAYAVGLGWVLLAMIQAPATFLILGVLGKRFAIIARRTGSVGITDFLRARYGSDTLVLLTSIMMIVFFMAAMVAQFIGGARLFQAVTGYPYMVGLAIFGLTVIIYTSLGGFRAVALTDAMQGLVMLAAGVVILAAVIYAGGGVASCMAKLEAVNPGLLTPGGADGKVPQPFILSFWILVGLGILGLPQTSQKCMGYRDSRSMHSAMVIGTFTISFMILCLHLTGVLSRAVLPDLPAGDMAMPTLTVRLLPAFWAGVFIAGPLAAIMSTVDSMLLLVCASLIKDIYIQFVHKGKADAVAPAKVRRFSMLTTLVVGAMVFVAAMEPPDLLVWINLFAFGGLEAAFLWPIILGLYWRKANASGAVWSVVAGVGCFFAISVFKLPIGGVHAIVPTLAVGLAAFLLGSRFGCPTPQTVMDIFWKE